MNGRPPTYGISGSATITAIVAFLNWLPQTDSDSERALPLLRQCYPSTLLDQQPSTQLVFAKRSVLSVSEHMMGSFSAIHWVMVLGVVVLLFGVGKLPALMGDFAKGLKAFKSGMKDDDAVNPPGPRQMTPPQMPESATETSPIGLR